MKPRNLAIVLIVGLFLINVATVAPARAGSGSHHRLEGFALGIGAAFIGSMVFTDHHVWGHTHGHGYGRGHHCKNHHRRGHHPRNYRHGHREWHRIWEPRDYHKIRKPGNRHHKREHIRGRRFDAPDSKGYWKKERFRASNR